MKEIKDILKSESINDKLALFYFDENTSIEKILFKFNLWGRYFFNKYYSSEDADFHKIIDKSNLDVYLGNESSFLDICFRGASKTSRTKLLIAYVILNDKSHKRRFIKILTRDIKNSTQFVTDIYNMMVQPRVLSLYPNTFMRTGAKREETMSAFTTSFGVKILAGVVGTSQRGQVQEDVRPDLIVFDDFEDRLSLRSAVTTQMIWDNMQEAINGLAKDGGSIYLCNYISERGNVHRLVERIDNKLLVPIITDDGVPTWNRFSLKDIEMLRKKADDFEGEYLNKPSAGMDIYFDRSCLESQPVRVPIKEVSNRKIFFNYNPSHMYGIGADVGGGIGLDHSADVTIDFSTRPARVVSTFKDNTLKPDLYGHELITQGRRFGECIIGPENNKFDTVINVLRTQDYPNIYFTEVPSKRAGMPPKTRTYGWNTNGATKYTMMAELKSAVEDGHLELTDADLIAELKSYTRDDLMDKDEDVRLTTRHFDLLIAVAIAWQMRKYAVVTKPAEAGYVQGPYERSGLEE